MIYLLLQKQSAHIEAVSQDKSVLVDIAKRSLEKYVADYDGKPCNDLVQSMIDDTKAALAAGTPAIMDKSIFYIICIRF